MTIPKKVITLKVVLVKIKPKITPIKVKGIANIIIKGSRRDSNCAAMTI
jgi:hypothetical protein